MLHCPSKLFLFLRDRTNINWLWRSCLTSFMLDWQTIEFNLLDRLNDQHSFGGRFVCEHVRTSVFKTLFWI